MREKYLCKNLEVKNRGVSSLKGGIFSGTCSILMIGWTQPIASLCFVHACMGVYTL